MHSIHLPGAHGVLKKKKHVLRGKKLFLGLKIRIWRNHTCQFQFSMSSQQFVLCICFWLFCFSCDNIGVISFTDSDYKRRTLGPTLLGSLRNPWLDVVVMITK